MKRYAARLEALRKARGGGASTPSIDWAALPLDTPDPAIGCARVVDGSEREENVEALREIFRDALARGTLEPDFAQWLVTRFPKHYYPKLRVLAPLSAHQAPATGRSPPSAPRTAQPRQEPASAAPADVRTDDPAPVAFGQTGHSRFRAPSGISEG